MHGNMVDKREGEREGEQIRGTEREDSKGERETVSRRKRSTEREVEQGEEKKRAEEKIGRASCREECRSRWSPYH